MGTKSIPINAEEQLILDNEIEFDNNKEIGKENFDKKDEIAQIDKFVSTDDPESISCDNNLVNSENFEVRPDDIPDGEKLGVEIDSEKSSHDNEGTHLISTDKIDKICNIDNIENNEIQSSE